MSTECLTIPIFDMDINLFNDRSEALAFYLDRNPEGGDEKPINQSRGVCITTDTCRMICVFDGGVRIAAHEAVHMAHAVLKETGVKDRDEALAYLVGYLTKEVLRFIEANKGEG